MGDGWGRDGKEASKAGRRSRGSTVEVVGIGPGTGAGKGVSAMGLTGRPGAGGGRTDVDGPDRTILATSSFTANWASRSSTMASSNGYMARENDE